MLQNQGFAKMWTANMVVPFKQPRKTIHILSWVYGELPGDPKEKIEGDSLKLERIYF